MSTNLAPTASGSAIVAALEAAYTDVRAHHPELPEVVFVTGTGLMGRSTKWGHFWRDRWVVEAREGAAVDTDALAAGRRPEVFIAGERLAQGAESVLETILHESAHALAVVRGVKATSRGGRYHNRRYLALAEEVGLCHPGPADKVFGWAHTSLTDATRERYAPTIARLQAGITVYLESPEAAAAAARPKQTGKSRNLLRAVCACAEPRVIRASRKVLESDPVICGRCMAPFTSDED